MEKTADFRKPTAIERWFNRVFGILARLGIGLTHNYVLTVTGRATARHYSTPVNLLKIDDKDYLVAPRGEAQWVLNVRVAKRLILNRGSVEMHCAADEVLDPSKPAILKEYLSRYTMTVQRYFSITPDAPMTDFEKIAHRHPVFLLQCEDEH